MNANPESTSDPQHHVRNIQNMLDDVLNHCRSDSAKMDEPKAQALFETTAEVLLGLRNAYEHYATRAEPAMTPQKQQQR
jgi:uncharacterized damage-inducible protein DinB